LYGECQQECPDGQAFTAVCAECLAHLSSHSHSYSHDEGAEKSHFSDSENEWEQRRASDVEFIDQGAASALAIIYTSREGHVYTVERRSMYVTTTERQFSAAATTTTNALTNTSPFRYEQLQDKLLVHWTFTEDQGSTMQGPGGLRSTTGGWGESQLFGWFNNPTDGIWSEQEWGIAPGQTMVIDLDEVGAVVRNLGGGEVSIEHVPRGSSTYVKDKARQKYIEHAALTANGKKETVALTMGPHNKDDCSGAVMEGGRCSPYSSTSFVVLAVDMPQRLPRQTQTLSLTYTLKCNKRTSMFVNISVHDEFPLGYVDYNADGAIGSHLSSPMYCGQDVVEYTSYEQVTEFDDFRNAYGYDYGGQRYVDQHTPEIYLLVSATDYANWDDGALEIEIEMTSSTAQAPYDINQVQTKAGVCGAFFTGDAMFGFGGYGDSAEDCFWGYVT